MALPHVRVPSVLAVAFAAVLVLVGASDAAKPRAAAVTPSVTAVSPLKLDVGQRLTVKGKNFLPGRGTTTVVFKRDGQRAIFVKADRATKTELVVVVPDKLKDLLAVKDGKPQSTTFRIRVLARRFARTFTPLARSPKIGPAPAVAPPGPVAPPVPPDCDKDGQADAVDIDDDNDLLPDSAEAGYGTDLCKPDSDADGMRDVWEIESALDLNRKAYFYPGKAPYPNPLWPGDAGMDFDGDGLASSMEHDLWQRSGAAVPLAYSDGAQDTLANNLGTACTVVAPEALHLDTDSDTCVTDDERDFDGDRLGNWIEARGPMVGTWWASRYEDEKPFFGHPDAPALFDSAAVSAIAGRTPMYADPDVDGDGLPDGADDQDHDGWTNEQELTRRKLEVDTNGDTVADAALRMNAYNPCLPQLDSRTCSRHPPFAEPWAPFDGSAGNPVDHDGKRVFLAN